MSIIVDAAVAVLIPAVPLIAVAFANVTITVSLASAVASSAVMMLTVLTVSFAAKDKVVNARDV